MTSKLTFLLLFGLTYLTCLGQRQADLTKFVKTAAVAGGAISDIDTLSEILRNKFIIIANDSSSKTHKDIQNFFEDYKTSEENKEYNIYPKKIGKQNVTVQYIDYSTNYGWVGQTMDSVFNSSTLTALVFIPAFDEFHKGQSVNTICFKATLEIYSETKLDSKKDYKREENITDLKMVDFGN